MKTLITFIKNIKYFYRLCKKCSDENCEFIIKKYQVKEIDRKLSRRFDMALLIEFDFVRSRLLKCKKGDKNE